MWLVCGRPGRSPLMMHGRRQLQSTVLEGALIPPALSRGTPSFVGRNPCELLAMDEAQGMQARSEPAGIYAVC